MRISLDFLSPISIFDESITIDVDTKKFTYLLILIKKSKSSDNDLNYYEMHVDIEKTIPLHCYTFFKLKRKGKEILFHDI